MNRCVNVIIQNRGGKYLLQMRDGNEGIYSPLKWGSFGGSINDNEEPVQGAAREINEELGIDVKPNDFEIAGQFESENDVLVYVVRYKKTIEWRDIEVFEGAGAGFFTKEEAMRIDIAKETKMLAEKYF
jgi:8-oxo-dGTP pyrophosphatase MutT (NUDIX family)